MLGVRNCHCFGVVRLFVYVVLFLSIPIVQAQAFDPDLNSDGLVSGLDVSIVAKCLGKKAPPAPDCKIADVNGDGNVDTTDLHMVQSAIGETGFPFTTPPDPKKVVSDPRGGTYPVNQVLLTVHEGVSRADAEALAASVRGKTVGYFPAPNGYQFEVPTRTIAELDAMLDTLKGDGRVKSVARNVEVILNQADTDLAHLKQTNPDKPELTGAYDRIQIQAAWNFIDEKVRPEHLGSVRIGIIDTGVDTSHPEFQGVKTVYASQDLGQPGNACFSGVARHGTQVSGIIGANNISPVSGYVPGQMNGIVSGVLSQQQYSLVVPGKPGLIRSHFQSDLQYKISKVISGGATVVNISMGVTRCSALDAAYPYRCGCASDSDFFAYKDQYQELVDKYKDDVLFVASAGNAGIDATGNVPGGGIVADNLLTVGATANLGKVPVEDRRAIFDLWSSSNSGPSVAISAPGRGVLAPGDLDARNTAGYSYFSGTSASTPLVTGVAALLRSLDSKLTPKDVKNKLVSSADRIAEEPGKPIGGRLNALCAVKLALGDSCLPTYRITDLGMLGNGSFGSFSSAADINESGQIAGYSASNALGSAAFLYTPGRGMEELPKAAISTGAIAINAGGQVIVSFNTIASPVFGSYLYTPGAGTHEFGHNGARGINDGGQVVGHLFLTASPFSYPFLYTPGDSEPKNLATLTGRNDLRSAEDINNMGQVTGYTSSGTGFLWSSTGGVVDFGGAGTTPSRINDAGQVVGKYSATNHGFRWSPTEGMIDIGNLPGGTRSSASGINNLGYVVGESDAATGLRAILWRNKEEGILDLNDLIDPTDPLKGSTTLTSAHAINNKGQIVGEATINGVRRAYLLTPQ